MPGLRSRVEYLHTAVHQNGSRKLSTRCECEVCRCNLQFWTSIWDHNFLLGISLVTTFSQRTRGTFFFPSWLKVGLQAPRIWGFWHRHCLDLMVDLRWSTSPKKWLCLSQKPPEAGQPRFENVDFLKMILGIHIWTCISTWGGRVANISGTSPPFMWHFSAGEYNYHANGCNFGEMLPQYQSDHGINVTHTFGTKLDIKQWWHRFYSTVASGTYYDIRR